MGNPPPHPGDHTGAISRPARARTQASGNGDDDVAALVVRLLLRLALRTMRLLAAGEVAQAREHSLVGARRIAEAMEATGDAVALADRVRAERTAWGHFYDALDALEAGIGKDDERALEIRARAVRIVEACRVRS